MKLNHHSSRVRLLQMKFYPPSLSHPHIIPINRFSIPVTISTDSIHKTDTTDKVCSQIPTQALWSVYTFKPTSEKTHCTRIYNSRHGKLDCPIIEALKKLEHTLSNSSVWTRYWTPFLRCCCTTVYFSSPARKTPQIYSQLRTIRKLCSECTTGKHPVEKWENHHRSRMTDEKQAELNLTSISTIYGLTNVPTCDMVNDAPIAVFLITVGNNSDVNRANIT